MLMQKYNFVDFVRVTKFFDNVCIYQITDLEDASVSLYVALFDYNPTMMSPNSDCYEDELPFSEGQLIKV